MRANPLEPECVCDSEEGNTQAIPNQEMAARWQQRVSQGGSGGAGNNIASKLWPPSDNQEDPDHEKSDRSPGNGLSRLHAAPH